MESNSQERTPLSRAKIIEYYSRADILEEMMKMAKDREFVGAYRDGSYHKRPNIVQFPSDIVQMAKNNVTSFHCSVERWTNPMQLSVQSKNYGEIRKGFDFLIDVDSRTGLETSQVCASIVCKFLEKCGVRNFGLKFSGRRGFHIIIPCEAFPEEVDYKKTKDLYPRVAVIMADYIRESIREELLHALIRRFTSKKLSEIVPNDSMDPFVWVDIEKGWGERHLFRAPYSLNEKTWLVSIPLDNPLDFNPKMAEIENVKTGKKFVKECEKGEATMLLIDAINWNAKREKMSVRTEQKKIMELPTQKIGEEHFPPCIKNILNGLEDGKKRSIFTLINFLRMMNWSWEEIEAKLMEWNAKNKKPLPASFIVGQLNWNKHQKKVFPASCGSELFYGSIGVCQPDNTCGKIKNPISYPFKKGNIVNLSRKDAKNQKFVCRQCSKTFATEKSLKAHQSRSHGESLVE